MPNKWVGLSPRPPPTRIPPAHYTICHAPAVQSSNPLSLDSAIKLLTEQQRERERENEGGHAISLTFMRCNATADAGGRGYSLSAVAVAVAVAASLSHAPVSTRVADAFALRASGQSK